jgi:hypothetical protein
MPVMASEFRSRNLLTQVLVTVCMTRPRLAAGATRALRTVGTEWRRSPKISSLALSGLYALTYYTSAARQFGDVRVFRSILRGQRDGVAELS